jgi:hypothetical protein
VAPRWFVHELGLAALESAHEIRSQTLEGVSDLAEVMKREQERKPGNEPYRAPRSAQRRQTLELVLPHFEQTSAGGGNIETMIESRVIALAVVARGSAAPGQRSPVIH